MRTLLIVCTSFLALITLRAGLVDAPDASSNRDQNSATIYPFSVLTDTMRYQQLFEADRFIGTESRQFQIVGLYFRVDSGPFSRPFTSTLPSIHINFSLTTRTESTLSSVFAENISANDQVVYGARPLPLSGTWFSSVTPQPWFGFTLDTPYYYNPSEGNLLMDVRNFAGGTTMAFDAADVVGDGVASVYALGVGSSSGTVETRGLAMLLDMNLVSVPEPSTWALLALGAVPCLLYWMKSKRNSTSRRSLNEFA